MIHPASVFLPCAWRYQPVEQQQSYQISCSMAKARKKHFKIGGSRHRFSPIAGAYCSKPVLATCHIQPLNQACENTFPRLSLLADSPEGE
jgi:hypothetical protein